MIFIAEKKHANTNFSFDLKTAVELKATPLPHLPTESGIVIQYDGMFIIFSNCILWARGSVAHIWPDFKMAATINVLAFSRRSCVLSPRNKNACI